MKKFNLAICQFPANNITKPAPTSWLLKTQPNILAEPHIKSIIPWRKSDTPIDMVRNLAVKETREAGADYILMIDSDMEIDCEPDGKPSWETMWDFMMARRMAEEQYWITLLREKFHYTDDIKQETLDHHEEQDLPELRKKLWKHFAPATIGVPYCGPPPHESVYVFKWVNYESNTPNVNFNLVQYDREQSSRFTGISEVAALPTGLILYDARTFDVLPKPWFAYEFADEPFNTRKASTEDVYQTRNASMIGMPQFCAWDCWAGHIKDKVVRKPVPYSVAQVPDVIAAAITANRVLGDYKVQFITGENDAIARPTQSPTHTLKSAKAVSDARAKLAT